VQRVRIQYTKRGRLRFTSHRDISRAFERAVRRAGLPVAYSSGFNPHPRLSYAGAAPTGAASEAEYMEVAMAQTCDPGTVREVLDSAMPPGLDVVDAVAAGPGALADRLQASRWTMLLSGVTHAAAEQAVAGFLAAEMIEVSRMTKRGLRRFDARAAVVSLHALPTAEPTSAAPVDAVSEEQAAACAILNAVVRHGEPSVRPDDVLAALREVAGLESSVAPIVQRVAQGPLDSRDGTVGDPLAADRDTRDN